MAVDNERVKQEATMAINGMLSLMASVLVAPEETVTNYVTDGNNKAAYQLIGVQTVAVVLANVVYKLLRNLLSKGTNYELGNFISGMINNAVSVIAVAFVGAIVASVLVKQAGGRIDFSRALSISSLQAVVMTPIVVIYRVIAGLGVSILTSLTSILYSGAEVLAIILTLYGFMVFIPDKKKSFYNVGIYFVVLLLVNFVVGKILN